MEQPKKETLANLKISNAALGWNVAVDLQVWITIIGIISLAIYRPSQNVLTIVSLLLILNIAVALGLAHKQLLLWTARQQFEIDALQKELLEQKVSQPVPTNTDNLPQVAQDMNPLKLQNG